MKKSIPKVRERESEASILWNDREREFPLTPVCKLLLVTFRLFTFCYFQLILVTFSFKLIIPLVIILVTFSFSDTAVAILSDTFDIGLSKEKSTKYVCVGVERCSAVENFVSSCEKQQQSYQFKTNLISSKYCAH